MMEEASKLRGLEARVAALETKFNFLLQFIRRLTEREEEKKKAMISKRQEEICPALSLSKATRTLPTPRRPAFHVPRPSRTEPRQFQPLPIPVPQLYTLLVKKKMITPVDPRSRIGPQPKDYNKDLTCDYHQGEVGHTVGNCRVLRHRIQDLLDQGVLKFRIEGIVNAIGAEKSDEVDITSAKIPWEPFPTPRAQKELAEAGIYKYHSEAQGRNLQSFKEVKKEVTSLITGARMDRIKEDFEEFCEKKKEELGKLSPATSPETSKPDPVVIQYATKEKIMLQTASVSTIQSSEKVPSVVIQVPQPFPYQDDKRVPWNYGMKVLHPGGVREKNGKKWRKAVEDPVKTKAAEDEAADFLRIIKSSEYSVVKQLSKMPSHISVLSLLLVSESHRKALLKGRGHIKALYISVKTNDRIVSKVLIDNGSALNVCPLSTLEKLDIDPTRVRVTSMVVRAFDGTRREGDHGCTRPERYPPPLHQKMKLIIGKPIEASFHSFEFVTVIHRMAAVEPKLSKAGIMVAREFVKAGFQPGQGLGCANQGRTAIRDLGRKQRQIRKAQKGKSGLKRKWLSPTSAPTFPASAMFQVDEGDVDELALLFTEDLSIDVITTEGDSTAPPIRPDHCKGVDLEDFLDEEDLKGYRIEEETLDEDTGKDTDFPNLLPHLMIPRGLETLEFEMFCEHGDPEFHLRRILPTGEDLARAFLDRYRHNLKSLPPPPSNTTTTTAEEEHAGPMVEGLSIHAITKEGDSTTPPVRHCQRGEEAKMWTCVPVATAYPE
uniref:G-patch domain-containing protein n=1 Tax=Fagus sylvatica TaxID=28930 RepID=A0A2N9II62_FAGSY